MSRGRPLGVALASLLLTTSLAPDLWVQAAVIVGSVSDAQSGAALAGADLILEGSGHVGLSSDDGRFRLAALPAGGYVLRVERVGYRPLRKSVTIPAGGTVVVDFAALTG